MKKKLLQTVVVFASFDLFAQGSNIHPDYEIKYAPLSHFESMNESIESGESYDPATGIISFANTDISLPGNSELKVELRRVLSVGENTILGNNEFGVWSIDTPFIMASYLDGSNSELAEGGWKKGKHCTGDFQQINIGGLENSYFLSPVTYWSGKLLHIPGETTEKFVKNTEKKQFYINGQVTKSNYGITKCTTLENGQEGIEVTGPNGNIYSFTEIRNTPRNFLDNVSGEFRHTRKLLVTKIKDRFGNYVTYNYEKIGSSRKLTAIESSDGRKIEIKYDGYATEVIVNKRVWKYSYHSSSGQLGGRLQYVTLPDKSFWEYSYDLSEVLGKSVEPIKGGTVLSNGQRIKAGACFVSDPNTIYNFSVKTPQGLLKEYKTKEIYFGRTNVSDYVLPFTVYPKDEAKFVNFNCNVNNSLISKKISGLGVESVEYLYEYSQNTGMYSESGAYSEGAKANSRASGFENGLPTSLPSNISKKINVRTTTIYSPKNKIINYYDRDSNSHAFENIIAVDTFDLNGNIVQRKEFKYDKGTRVGDAWYRDIKGFPIGSTPQESAKDEYRINKISEKIYQNSDEFTTEFSEYDEYGYPKITKEFNSVNFRNRITRKYFKHDPYLYIFGLPSSTELSSDGVNFTKTEEVVYHDFSNTGLYQSLKVPYEFREFGVWKLRISKYHTNGMVNRIEFNHQLSNSTPQKLAYQFVEFNDFRAGLPQNIIYPSSEETSSVTSPIATVSYNRLIDLNGWITEEKTKTGLKVSYSYDEMGRVKLIDYDDTSLDDITVTYDFTVPDNSISQLIQRGNYRKKTDLDALNRVMKTMEWDEILQDNSKVIVNTKYNSMGLVEFISNPSFTDNDSNGTFKTYDSLGRLVSEKILPSENETLYKYLQANTIEKINGRSNKTTTKYLSFGVPDYTMPISIADHLNNKTSVSYNIFGNIEEVSQSNIVQKFIYNNRQLLCLQVIPEAGVKSIKYYDSGEIKSYGEGLSGSAKNCEDYIHVPPRFVEYTYNNSGLKSNVKYYDGTPETKLKYDPYGRVVQLDSGTSNWKYAYNQNNSLRSESLAIDNFIFEQNYEYNSLEQLNKIKYFTFDSSTRDLINGLALNVLNDAVGNVIKMFDAENTYADKVEYHPNGKISKLYYGNNLKYLSTLDSQFRVEKLEVSTPFSNLHNVNYGYDENDNITSITDNIDKSKNISLTYDEIDRISTGTGPWGSGSFTYSGIGNIETKILNNLTTIYSYDSKTNRLKQFANRNFSYDESGNVVNNGLRAFTYNMAKQLKSSGPNLSYVYDAYNRRIKQLKGADNSYSTYDISGKLVQRLSKEKISTYTLYIGSQLIAEVDVTGPPVGMTAPEVVLTVSEELVPSIDDIPDCQKYMVCQHDLVPKYNYRWSSLNATTCQGSLRKTQNGFQLSTTPLSGTSGNKSVVSSGDGALFTLSVTCRGSAGTGSKSLSFGGVGSEI